MRRLEGHDKLAGGLREAGSWKALLDRHSDEAEVFDAAKVLCSGPGAQVLAMKQEITEDNLRCCLLLDGFLGCTRLLDNRRLDSLGSLGDFASTS